MSISAGRVKVPIGHIPNSVVRVPCGVSRSAHVLIPPRCSYRTVSSVASVIGRSCLVCDPSVGAPPL